MSELDQLEQTIKEELIDRGIVDNIQKDLHQQVTNILTNKQSNIIISEEERRKSLQLKSKNAIMNELIKEYLSFNAYYHTNDVFQLESNSSSNQQVDRRYIAKYLKIVEDKNTQELPLFYGLVFGKKKLLTRDLYQDHDQRYVTTGRLPSEQEPKQIYQNIFNMAQPNAILYE